MKKQEFMNLLSDLRHITLFPRRYATPQGKSAAFWGEVQRRYGNEMKALRITCDHWRVIEFVDGHEELAYLRELSGGVFSGAYPAIYRGFLPRRIDCGTFAHIKRIRNAF